MSRLRIRLLLHALDRTGPPMLALTFARWLASASAGHEVSWVAFRGGPMLDEMADLGPVTLLLDPSEPWDHDDPENDRVVLAGRRGAAAEPADVALAVSVAAGQCLPYLREPQPPLVTWSVERGDDLHWIHGSLDLIGRTSRWLAGSSGTLDELQSLLGADTAIDLVPEFVQDTPAPSTETTEHRRRTLGQTDGGLLVIGAGIATHRKAPDLFIETALEAARRHGPVDQFVWLGGEHDELFPSLLGEVRRLGLGNVRFLGNITDVVPWLDAADVMVHPARLDAFPLVCLHAALAGTPVIGFHDRGGLPEMFAGATLGASYPDLTELVDALDSLRDPAPRRKAATAQRIAARRFTADAAAPTLLARVEATARTSG